MSGEEEKLRWLNSGACNTRDAVTGSTSMMESSLVARDKVGVQDFVLLENFQSEDAFIGNLCKRFKMDIIYTYIGSVVVSINPYKPLGIYTQEAMEEYRGVNLYELPPHIFAVADAAYQSMRNEGVNQCVLISGESGAGKTEASKHILQYLAQCSEHAGRVDVVKDRLLLSNPVLEAFGNARTNKNDNSSRFGKYMDVEFDFKGTPVGGHIHNYLLEKSRVVHQAEGERNFHIFYQLLGSRNTSLLQSLELSGSPDHYFYLSQGSCMKVEGMDDWDNFQTVNKAIKVLGFTSAEMQSLWKILAAILHLGNTAYQDNKHGLAEFKNDSSLSTVVKLLLCPEAKLRVALTHRSIEARNERVMSPLNAEQACYARDALAKAIYERLFEWLVRRLNASLEKTGKDTRHYIGLLDIYGFEIIVCNSFEQFCINFCNEKLQQLFIELTLKSEQEEYTNEGIEWEPVEYFNNKVICDLVEERHKGILAVLDEECLRPGDVSDSTFLAKLMKTVPKHKHLIVHETSGYEGRKTIGRNQFRLLHYAGEVTYNIEGFVDKNNDLLYRSLKEVASLSSDIILKEVFPESELFSMKRPPTAGTQFRTSLNQLMEILKTKEPSYVRCIKPNHAKRPNLFDNSTILHQVKYLGLMENLRVRRAGFCYRRTFTSFLQRYKSLCHSTWPNWKGTKTFQVAIWRYFFALGDPRGGVTTLCKHLKLTGDQYKIGKTKLFIRFPKTLFSIEDQFQNKKNDLATLISAQWRMYHFRTMYKKMKLSAIVIQAHWRRVKAQRYVAKYRAAALTIRRFVTGFIHRHKPKCAQNLIFLEFVRVNYLERLSRALPGKLVALDELWLRAPVSLVDASSHLKVIYRRLLAVKLMKSLTPETKSLYTLKIVASDLFKGHKSSYPSSVPLKYNTSYLSQQEISLKEQLFDAKYLDCGGHKFSLHCTKYDRHGYKARQRIFVITEKGCYLLEPGNFKVKENFRFREIAGIFGDLILETVCAIELAVKLGFYAKKLENISVVKTGSISHDKGKGKTGLIVFEEGPDTITAQGKTGNLEVISMELSGI
ncbi:hypothetical protein EMCRGX_G023847 [Ephydatia muelleri]